MPAATSCAAPAGGGGDPGPVPRPALDPGRGLRRGARARAGRGLPGHDRGGRLAFFSMLAEDYGADRARILAAVEAYRAQPTPSAVQALRRACEAPRHELFGG